MKRAAELGIILVPATGRIYNGIPAALCELPFIRYCICMNGAWVGDVREKRTLYSAEIPAKRAVELLRFMDGLPVIYDCYQDDWGWMSRSMYEKVYEYVSDKKVAELTQRTRNQVDDLKALLLERGRPVQKMQMHFKDHAARLEWRSAPRSRSRPGIASPSATGQTISVCCALPESVLRWKMPRPR